MPYSKDFVADIVVKITMIAILIMIAKYFGSVAINTFSIMQCTSCDIVTNSFIFIVLPISTVFIFLYRMFKHTTE